METARSKTTEANFLIVDLKTSRCHTSMFFDMVAFWLYRPSLLKEVA
jgi:hypothetical protein